MNRRLKLIQHTIFKRDMGGSFIRWLQNCFCLPCSMLAKRKIEEIQEVEKFKKVKLENYDGFLYYPNTLSMEALYQILTEQLYSWQWHFYQIPETEICKEDVVFDCGCAEGAFAFLNRDNFKKAYVFEPLPEYLEGLQKTFKDFKNVNIMKMALGDKCGEAYLEKSGISSYITDSVTDTKIEMTTIDNICEENDIRFSYLKADLEGYEMNLLKGAAESIRKFKPKIAITTYHKKNDAESIMEYLKSLVPSYKFIIKGIEVTYGVPVMLHAWVE